MDITREEWNKIYQIEARQEVDFHSDVDFLLKLVWKLNGNVIDPRTHDEIQKMIDQM